MTAQELLDELLAIQASGLDMSKAGVTIRYTEYDSSVPFDMGAPAETYPEGVRIINGEIVLGSNHDG